MAQILTYAAGVERQGKNGMTGRERQAKAIMNLAQKFSRDMQANALEGIRASQQDAQIDILQNTIDPKRKENDEAYAATILRNDLNSTNQKLQQDLDNPQSEFANMTPEDYKKYLSDQATEFYNGIEGSPHVNTQARVFTTYMAKNQPGLIAKQAKVYKDGMKAKQGQAAVTALATLPPGEGDAFALNTDYLISEMLPADRFSSRERLAHLMGAALGAAHQGDRRLLEHLEDRYDAEALVPVKVQQAENAYTQAMREKENAMYSGLYSQKQQAAENGEYTNDQWAKDIEDPEMVRRWSRGTINSWKKLGHKAHVQQMNYSDGMARFMVGDPLTGLDDQTQQQIFHDAKRNMLEKAGQAGTQEAKLGAMAEYAFFMSKQGSIDKELKKEMGARLNRPVFTKEAWSDPQFQEAAVVFQSLYKVLTPSQMVAQLGDEAYSNGMLVQQFMNDASGDPEKAADAYIMHMNRRKDMPELKTKKPHREETKAAVAAILSGELEKHDPAMDRWLGMSSAADDAIHTGQIAYEIEKQYGIEIQRGLDHEAALELAQNKVAAKTKYFGNEMIWTEGADLNEMLYMPNGSTANDRDKAWENFADSLGVDPDKAHFTTVGQYGYITDDKGEPIEEIGLFPLIMIGNMYEGKMREDLEGREARDLEDKLNDVAGNNRMFETSMNARTGFDDNAKILADGTTLGNYKDSDEEGRLLMRKMYEEENRTWLGKLGQKFVGFVHDVQAGKYQGEAADRFRSVATDATLQMLDSPSKPMSDKAVAGMWEVDARSADAKAQNDRLLRSRDGEVKLTEDERRALTEEDLKPVMHEDDLPDAKVEALNKAYAPVKGMTSKSDSFKYKTAQVAERIGVKPEELAAIMKFESNLNPKAVNKKSGAYGLIQFMPTTLKELGVTKAQLKKMSPEEQLDLVGSYFEMWKSRGKNITNLSDMYMTVLWPRAVGQPDDYVLWEKGTKEYSQNSGLDLNGDGTVTKKEASAKVVKMLS